MAVSFGAVDVGDVKMDVIADGTGFERSLRRAAHGAGVSGGKELSKSFTQQVKKEEGAFTRAFRGIADRFNGIFKDQRAVRGMSAAWGDLSHNTRQWTLIIGAVLAGMQSLAVLSSAAAGGLFILGGAATGALVGIGALVIAFQGMAGEIDKLPASIRPAARAFQDLKEPLKDLQDFLQERAFAGTEKAFESIGNTIRKLIPAFGPLGDAINDIINQFAEWSASEEGIRLLTGLVENSAPIFRKTADVVGKLGRALLIAFNNPRFQKAIDDLLTGVGGMFDRFSAWVASDDFSVWIEDTAFIMGKLGDLLGATSKMLQDLVTPEAIARTGKFLDNLTKFMPHLGDLLDILGRLDIFGIIAQALAELGDALSPIAEPMGKIADELSRIIGIAIDEWGENLKSVFETVRPFFEGLADILAGIPDSVIRDFADALFLLATALTAIKLVRIAGAVTGLSSFFAALSKGNGIVGAFKVSKLSKIAAGLASFAAITAIELIPDDFWDKLGGSGATKTIATWTALGLMFGPVGALIGSVIGHIISAIEDLEGTMNDVIAGPASEFFASLIPEEWLGSDNPFEVLLGVIRLFITDTGTAFGQLPQMFAIVWSLVTAEFEKAGLAIANWLTTRANELAVFWNGLVAEANARLALFSAAFTSWLGTIGANWNSFWGQLGIIVRGTFNYIIAFVAMSLNSIRASITQGLQGAGAAWNSFWGAIPNAVAGAVSRVAGFVRQLIALVNSAMGSVNGLSRSAGNAFGRGGGGGGLPAFASGGILDKPRRIFAGEAGPEAVVPLRRPLGSVDPSVRFLSAIAQGLTPVPAGGSGAGRTNNVESGAIVINEARDPLATGVEVLDRLTQRLI